MIKETFKQAIQNVWSNKVRTFLTTVSYTHLDVYKRQEWNSCGALKP